MTEEGQTTTATPQGAANGGRKGNTTRRRRNGRYGKGKPPVSTTNSNKADPETTTPTVAAANDQGGPTPPPPSSTTTNVLEVTNTATTTPPDGTKTASSTNQRRRNRGRRNNKKAANATNGPEETGVTTEPSISLSVEPDIAVATNSNGNNDNDNKNHQDRPKKKRNKKKVAPATTTSAATSTEESNGHSEAKDTPEVSNPEGAVSTVDAKGTSTPQEAGGKKRRNRKGKNPKQENPTTQATQGVVVESEVVTTPATATSNGKRGKKPSVNNQSWDPALTMVRPSLRVCMASPENKTYDKPRSGEDLIVVPDLFGKENDLSLYDKLVEEVQPWRPEGKIAGARVKLTPTFQGAHLVALNPQSSKTFQDVVNKLCQFFQIKKSFARLDWYRDSKDWKPFHHDSAAYNKHHVEPRSIAVMATFGACREFGLLKSNVEESVEAGSDPDPGCRINFPQPNNCCISFGQDVNLHFKHAINALPDNLQDGKGSISILVWGQSENSSKNESPGAVSDLETSPPTNNENEATERPKKPPRRRNVRRKNGRQPKGAAQAKDHSEVPPAEKTP